MTSIGPFTPPPTPSPKETVMTEEERVKAIPKLNDWKMRDMTVKAMVLAVLDKTGQPTVGHIARFCPEQFDELFEESEAMMQNPI
jgi:hypothetical protein